MFSMSTVTKRDIPMEHWDRLYTPSACLAMITTVDKKGNVNAASFGSCLRVSHEPVYVAFTVGVGKDTYRNVLATKQFVVNLPSFDRGLLEKVLIVGLPFARGVNELVKANLTALPSRMVKPPRIAECNRHFECRLSWTKRFQDRMMVCGKVVAASANTDCVDKDDYVILEKAKPAHYCGLAYVNKFVAEFEVMEVEMTYEGEEKDGLLQDLERIQAPYAHTK